MDNVIHNRFAGVHASVASGECSVWRKTAEGSLAEIIVLDQFSRNLFRNSQKAFETDKLALSLAEEAIKQDFDKALEEKKRVFMYMPYMHSESPEVHKTAVVLFESLDDKGSLKYERIHKKIIDQFGRYPHRNKVLGRPSTAEEIEYLNNNSESFF